MGVRAVPRRNESFPKAIAGKDSGPGIRKYKYLWGRDGREPHRFGEGRIFSEKFLFPESSPLSNLICSRRRVAPETQPPVLLGPFAVCQDAKKATSLRCGLLAFAGVTKGI